ncbi:CoA ester lyase [Nesterenkonia sp. MY13]|uniref:CoA ester lyase n=1 Tax=Nesterenkonia sedimenti TaxID=1463632 RepID=A0A7X8TM81_9MICC|nr:CoA ester lyase [Nesterenkonia sedimenti]NLS11144.1 CoA ester lyase [Nesterenkonia sedimenti]
MSTTDLAFPLGPALLFCPADRPERYAKAADRADAVILDLEDAVAPADKPAARSAVAEHLAQAPQELLARTIVRVNPPGTEDFENDASALAASRVQYVMLAKAEAAEQVQQLQAKLPQAKVVALCETAAGVTAAEALAAEPGTAALMWGAEDLIASIGGSSSRLADGRYRDIARYARSRVLLAAAAYGKAGIDSIYADIADTQGLSAECEDAVGSGFAAKACIHPAQVETIRGAYRPSDEEVEYAQALLAEVPKHGGVFQFRGAMVDGPLIQHAERILQRV